MICFIVPFRRNIHVARDILYTDTQIAQNIRLLIKLHPDFVQFKYDDASAKNLSLMLALILDSQ